MQKPFTHVHLEALGRRIDVARMEGREAMSQPFEFECLAIVDEGSGVDPESLLGHGIDVVFVRHEGGEEEEVRRVHGLAFEVDETLDEETELDALRIRIVPRIFHWTLHETNEIYLDATVPQVIEKKLLDLGLQSGTDYDLRIYDSYPSRELVVQWRESDLAFISRLTEHLGISFFFDQRDGMDVLVFTDDAQGFLDNDGSFVTEFERRGDKQRVFQLASSTKVIPGTFVVRDYNYRTPQVEMHAESSLDKGVQTEVVEFGAHFKTQQEGAKLAKIRAEERLATRKVYTGKSDLAGMHAGRFVTIEGHPRGDITLLVTEVVHRAKQTVRSAGTEGASVYENEIRGVRKGTPFRPPRRTPKPKVHGVISGIVEAAQDGPYAEIDDEGRYRVRFLFDTGDTPDGKASRPVRMVQPHSGPGYGMHFPLRAGVEVAIVCVDGDPDRPMIAGTVPNPTTTSPVTASNATRNVLRTGGGNEINIDDKEGSHRIKLTTPHMSTSFQLGAPNDPESGAMLNTLGASSTVATGGVAAMSSLGTTIDLFGKVMSAGDITTIAKKPGLGEKALTLLEAADTMLGLAAAGIDLYQAWHAAKVAKLQDDQNTAQKSEDGAAEKVAADENKMGDAMKNVAGRAPQPPPDPDTTNRGKLVKAWNDYKAARDQWEKDTGDYETAEDAYNDAVRSNVTKADGKTRADGSQAYTKDATVEAKKRARDDAKATVDTDWAAIDGEGTAADDKLAALKAAMADMPADDADVKTLNDALTSYAADKPKLDDAHGKTRAAKKSFDDESYTLSTPEAKDLESKKVEMELARTGYAAGTVLFSAIAAIYNWVTKSNEKLKCWSQWREAKKAIDDAKPKTFMSVLAESAHGMTSFIDLDTQHTLGSTQATTVYADMKLLLTAPEITICGYKPVAVPPPTGRLARFKEKPVPPSPTAGRIQLSAEKWLVLSSSDTAEISSKSQSSVTSVGNVTTFSGGWTKIASDKLVTVLSNDEDVEIQAPKAGKKIALTAEAKVEAKAKEVSLEATNKAAIKTTDAAGNVNIDAGANGAVTITVGNFTVKVTKDQVVVGNKSGTPGLKITAQEIALALNGSNSVKIASSGTTIEGARGKVTLRGGNAQIEGQKVLLGV